jgi:hypothetical protein
VQVFEHADQALGVDGFLLGGQRSAFAQGIEDVVKAGEGEGLVLAFLAAVFVCLVAVIAADCLGAAGAGLKSKSAAPNCRATRESGVAASENGCPSAFAVGVSDVAAVRV